tara:strand:+ start:553 stop:705 length:153 start_codon:yes stop_codon:yes gene_type:complete
VKKGDLVQHVGRTGIGVITEVLPLGYFRVAFVDGKYTLVASTLEVISESR